MILSRLPDTATNRQAHRGQDGAYPAAWLLRLLPNTVDEGEPQQGLHLNDNPKAIKKASGLATRLLAWQRMEIQAV